MTTRDKAIQAYLAPPITPATSKKTQTSPPNQVWIGLGTERYYPKQRRSEMYFTEFVGFNVSGKRYRVDARGRLHRPWRTAWVIWLVFMVVGAVVVCLGMGQADRLNPNDSCPGGFSDANGPVVSCIHYEHWIHVAVFGGALIFAASVLFVVLICHCFNNQARTMHIPVNDNNDEYLYNTTKAKLGREPTQDDLVRQWAYVNERHDNAQFWYWFAIGVGVAAVLTRALEHHDG